MPASTPLRVVCIDDEPDMLNVMAMILTRAGHVVHTALDGYQGIPLLRAIPVPDVVVINCLMPRVSGMEVVAFIAADRRLDRAGIVFDSALRAHELPIYHAAWPRVDVWLAVPFRPNDLLDAVRRAHAHRSPGQRP